MDKTLELEIKLTELEIQQLRKDMSRNIEKRDALQDVIDRQFANLAETQRKLTKLLQKAST